MSMINLIAILAVLSSKYWENRDNLKVEVQTFILICYNLFFDRLAKVKNIYSLRKFHFDHFWSFFSLSLLDFPSNS